MAQPSNNAAQRLQTRNQQIVGVLDIGTSKICCVIATDSDAPRLLGLGHQRARGIKAGLVVDLDQAEQCIRAAVSQAERQAGITLDAVHVSIAGGQLTSHHFAATAPIISGVVRDGDMARLHDGARHFCERNGSVVVHLNRIAYRLDAAPGGPDPLGMAGRTLAGDMHAVTADEGPIRNLSLLIERCYLRSARFTPAALASARAVATAEELRAGVTVIDFGAGTTSIAVIADGHDVFAESVPIGGNHLTFDILHALGTPFAEAERIKVLYGTLLEAESDDRDFVTYPRSNDSDAELHQTTRAHLRKLLRPRVENLLSQVMEKLVASGLQAYGGDRLVLTGGASQLVGLAMVTGRHWGSHWDSHWESHVRVASPQPFVGMVQSSCNPAFATAFGLVAAAANPATIVRTETGTPRTGDGYLGRVGQWLRESF